MRTESITEYNIVDDNGSAFGNEISLLYFKEQEWKNMAKSKKSMIEKLGKYLNFIQKDGLETTKITSANRKPLRFNDLQKKSRFYKAIKDLQGLDKHYEYKLTDKARVMISYSQTKDMGYLICFDPNHSALKK